MNLSATRQAPKIAFAAAIVLGAGIAGLVIPIAISVPAPAAAQRDAAAALNARVVELTQAGKYSEAIPLAQRLVAIREKTLGPNHPNVAPALNSLALLYDNLGRYADAEPLFKRSLAILERGLGANHPNVAIALNNLAGLYYEQSRYADAEPLYKRALAVRENVLGAAHPDVAEVLNNLANLYQNQTRYADAEPLYKRALVIREKALGPDHPDVAASLNDLGEVYRKQARYADAEPLYKRALAIYEKALGPNHRNVANPLNNLAALYDEQARYAAAEPLYKRSLAIREEVLGPDHPDVAQSLGNLANLYHDQGRYADAEPLYKRAIAIYEKAFGPDHPLVATVLNNLAALYHEQARYADAERLHRRSVEIRGKALGPDHLDVAQSLGNLANLYRTQGRYADAEPLYKRALAIREKVLGPDHPDIAQLLNSLAYLYQNQARYADAEPLYKRSIAISEKALGPDHPEVVRPLSNLAELYAAQDRYADVLPLVQRLIVSGRTEPAVALPLLFGAQSKNLISGEKALDDSLNVVQRAAQTSAGEALNALAVRFSAGTGRLAELVRKDQDLAAVAAGLDKAIIAAVSKEPPRRDAAAEQRIKDRIAAIAKERDDISKIFAREFPDYAALSRPEPLTTEGIQPLLAADEALVVVNLGANKSYVWAISRSGADWKELAVTSEEVSKAVSKLRGLLDFYSARPFDMQASFELYQKILAPVADLLRGKPRLSLVVNGALTSLPPQLLVTRDLAGKALKDVDWLIRTHAVTVLPSVASLKVLRGKSAVAGAKKPLIGFADPVFDRDQQQLQQNRRVAADVSASRGIRGTVADIGVLRTALPPLPDTANELREVAASVNADSADVILGLDATVSRVKREKLDQYRIVYFATHGLLAGEVADFAKLNAEPALVLSLPEKPTEFDDGLLTASEVAQLKLNADWVVLSACNTAAGDKPGAEALSGLARAFFYAGGRSLLVSNWEVETRSAVALMVGTFAALAADPKLSHAEALQKSMLAMIDNAQHPEWADPKYWAPFVVVGEPAKSPN